MRADGYPNRTPLLQGSMSPPGLPDDALVELLRARLAGFGPLTFDEVRASAYRWPDAIAQEPSRLEREGYVCCAGSTGPGIGERTMVRRTALSRLDSSPRSAPAPGKPWWRCRISLRFLFDWQHLSDWHPRAGLRSDPRLSGSSGSYAAASAWDGDLLQCAGQVTLPAR